jgi:dynein heavy chain
MSEKGSVSERIQSILDTSTYVIWRYIDRGLFENDKVTFLVMIVFKKLITNKKLNASDISLYLKGGGDLD